jgi:hypothetical protein
MAVNLLLSYAAHSGTDLEAARRDLVCGQLMVDSGAFTAFTCGRTIVLDEYAAYLQRWTGHWDHAITLDVIGDPVASRANTRRLHARGLPVMPVFTRSDTLAEFDAMVADCRYVAVGGLVGLPRKAQLARVTMLQRRAANAGGGIHALGIGAMPILRAARPYSADASTVQVMFRLGKILYFTGRDLRQAFVWDAPRLTRDIDLLRAHGIDIGPIVRDQRMPKDNPERDLLTQAMGLAYAAADEYLKTSGPATAPLPGGPDGPHLYIAVGPVDVMARLDRRLHTPGATHPRIWSRYGHTHRCHMRELTDA